MMHELLLHIVFGLLLHTHILFSQSQTLLQYDVCSFAVYLLNLLWHVTCHLRNLFRFQIARVVGGGIISGRTWLEEDGIIDRTRQWSISICCEFGCIINLIAFQSTCQMTSATLNWRFLWINNKRNDSYSGQWAMIHSQCIQQLLTREVNCVCGTRQQKLHVLAMKW